jgi:hypothetical protein
MMGAPILRHKSLLNLRGTTHVSQPFTDQIPRPALDVQFALALIGARVILSLCSWLMDRTNRMISFGATE